jgi:phospholipid-binding lipoprotein MlaA
MIKLPQKQFLLKAFCCLTLLFTTHCLAADVRTVNPADPYEPFNRVMFNFNDYIDRWVLKPIATVYNKVMPKPLAKGINNIFSNIDNIPTVINDVLQANFYQATSDAWRFAVNTTVGIGGFFDVAQHIGLDPNAEDLGLTFAHWGWKDSNYLVLPFLGPSTVRDGVAWPINYEYFTIYPYINPWGTRYAIYGVSLISKRAELLHYGDVMDQAALDRYVFMRDAYLQSRAYRIERNKQLGDPYLVKNNHLEHPQQELEQ